MFSVVAASVVRPKVPLAMLLFNASDFMFK